jgi:hypothetical protein
MAESAAILLVSAYEIAGIPELPKKKQHLLMIISLLAD